MPEAEVDEEPCRTCEQGGSECESCDEHGEDTCTACYGIGWRIPEHCCDCGGSPYCDCCKTCKQCVATCQCPVKVPMSDGSTLTLGPAHEVTPDA